VNKKKKKSCSDSLRIHAVSEQVKTVSEVSNLILKSYTIISEPVRGFLSPRQQPPGEANHSPQPNAELKNELRSYTFTPSI